MEIEKHGYVSLLFTFFVAFVRDYTKGHTNEWKKTLHYIKDAFVAVVIK